MSESQRQHAVTEQDQFEARRAFLRKAGLGAVGIGALWAVPRISTVKASPAYSAATAPPCTVTKIFPAADEVVPQVFANFTWQHVTGAAQYRVQLVRGTCANPEGGIVDTHSISSGGVGVDFSLAFLAGATLHWKVTALDSLDLNTANVICESECTNFTVEDLVP